MISLIGGALRIAVGAGVGMATGALSSAAASYVGALSTAKDYHAVTVSWQMLPIRDPDPQVLLELLRRGDERTVQLAGRSLLRQGITFDRGTEHGELWRAILGASWPIPGVADIITAYVRGGLSKEQLCEKLSSLGVPAGQWVEVIRSSLATLSVEQALAMWQRGLLRDEQLAKIVRRNGYEGEEWVQLFRDGSTILPSPADVIRFAVREAFSDEQAKTLGLDAELQDIPQYRELAAAVGMGEAKYRKADGTMGVVDVPKLAWRAHWELPSPSMAFTFLHRLRPERIARFQATLPPDLARDLTPVTGKEVAALLRAADYAPQWRPRMAATSYLPLTRVDARRLFQAELIDKNELTEQYLDQGYVRADAEKMAEWAASERDIGRQQQDWRAAKGPILRAYALGWMPRATAAVALMPLTFRSATALEAWQRLPPAQQEQQALANRRVQTWLLTTDVQTQNELVQQRLRSIQQRLLAGIIDAASAHRELGGLKLAPNRVQQWREKWASLLAGPRRTYSLQQLLTLFRDGALSQGELMRRAINLGYSRQDILILDRQAGIIRRRQAEADAARSARAGGGGGSGGQRGKAWRSTLAALTDWAERGVITHQQFGAILADKGYQPDEIRLILADLGGADHEQE